MVELVGFGDVLTGFVSILTRAAGRMTQPHLGCLQQHRGEGWGRTGSWQGSATWAGQVLSPLSHLPGRGALSAPTPHLDNAPSQGSSTGTGGSAPPSHSQQEKGQRYTRLFPPSWMRQGLFLDEAGGISPCTSLAGTLCQEGLGAFLARDRALLGVRACSLIPESPMEDMPPIPCRNM